MTAPSSARHTSKEESAVRFKPPGACTPHVRPYSKAKDIIYQTIVVAIAFGVVAFLARNVVLNTHALRIETGFDFLQKPAGFAISQTLIPYDRASTYLDAFVVAFLNTVSLTVVCIIIATVLGVLVALARVSSNPLVSRAAIVFIETVRNIPLLLQLLIWYFVVTRALPHPHESLSVLDYFFLNNRGLFFPLPSVGLQLLIGLWGGVVTLFTYLLLRQQKVSSSPIGSAATKLIYGGAALLVVVPVSLILVRVTTVEWSLPKMMGFSFVGGAKVVPEFVAMTLGIVVYSTAFIAEVFRGGLNSVPVGLREAGLALGLKSWFVNYRIVVPLALRAALLPLGGQYVIMLKNTSLAAAIAYPDLMQVMAGTALNQTGQPLEVMVITLGAYVFLGLLVSFAVNMLNRRQALVSS